MVMQYPQHIPLTDYESNVMVTSSNVMVTSSNVMVTSSIVMVISSIVMNVTKNEIIPSIFITSIVN